MCDSTEDFVDSLAVINGYSELMKKVFGAAAGTGARSAVAGFALPGGIPVRARGVYELHAGGCKS